MLEKQHVSHSPQHLSVYRNELVDVDTNGVTFRHCGYPTMGNARAISEWVAEYKMPFTVRSRLGRITVARRGEAVQALTAEGITFPHREVA